MYEKVLVPLDGSEVAEGVLPWVKSLVTCTSAEVTLLRVITYPHYDYLLADPGLVLALHEALESEAKDYLARVAGELMSAGLQVKAEVCSAAGAVADTIIDYAEAGGIDLIAMSTHGRTGPARWFLGSVADRVVRGARCPVLMYRPLAAQRAA